ncbi:MULTISPECIES: choline/ethanolamine kinase family protein [unclassified Rhizobium]|uniref:choline/ethanolamine kinase family protein n=1 Tax=unclassified Rhizobium TaxID=2613769 RepID=UPI00161F09A6|nr:MULTISPECIES: choline/ethanolamine kinase family protein [unclassified Rhizobium]MBB3287958.1 thiamine kinase-like enzyme [Rhizobium sp. BK252]MBB3402438.1 thiamine kinase-like enzyme [Rhizobium sp. BK289]MBB3415014.1 thiamine kinase-like enzyme [Rhizobium sp. BK284]MBB3482903.1 thiamine kinase-like enzyme [Rhizobium sp. BK347]MDK4720531.1 phosphotransferase family protein [Rhizobium sp. CNPSo 3968]
MAATPEDRIHSLGIWHGAIEIAPLAGGITNRNYLVGNAGRRFVVRLGADIPVHHISRANELAASRAAHAAGLSPAVIHHEPGILVLDYIDARPLSADDMRNPAMMSRAVPLVRSCHRDVGKYFRGQAAIFWVFHVVRDYAAVLEAGGSRHRAMLPSFLETAERLEREAGPFEIAFGHNDLLAANFLDDGKRLWLIDWDYAGFNTPLFDLGGLASNNEFSEAQEEAMLEAYFEAPVGDELHRRYQAMKCASLLRETMWSMVSEIHSDIEFDYSSYTVENLRRFESAWQDYRHS